MDIIDFCYGEDYTLNVTFEDGTKAIKDMKPLLNRGVFQALQDERFFRSAELDDGVIRWPNGADFCPDAFYQEVKNRLLQ